jgi:hypothetical protein
MEYDIKNYKSFFGNLGGLHDACVNIFSLDTRKNILLLSISDLNCNLVDFPGYIGQRPVNILFKRISDVDANIQLINNIFCIYDMNFFDKNGLVGVKIDFSPSGYISCFFKQIQIDDFE